MHSCPHCEYICTKLAHLKSHLVSHTQERNFKCTICDNTYLRKDHLNRHVKACHEKPEKEYQCSICSAKFAYKHGLTRHQKRSHGKPFNCTICELGFTKKHLLVAHTFLHTGVPGFKCPTCDEAFSTRSKLLSHQKKHVIPVCCGEVFSTKEEWKEHVRNHANVCEICGKNLGSFDQLKQHRLLHQNSVKERKTHQCSKCDKAYTKLSNLQAHFASAHGVRKESFACDICHKLFSYKHVLERHVKKMHISAEARKRKHDQTTMEQIFQRTPQKLQRKAPAASCTKPTTMVELLQSEHPV